MLSSLIIKVNNTNDSIISINLEFDPVLLSVSSRSLRLVSVLLFPHTRGRPTLLKLHHINCIDAAVGCDF